MNSEDTFIEEEIDIEEEILDEYGMPIEIEDEEEIMEMRRIVSEKLFTIKENEDQQLEKGLTKKYSQIKQDSDSEKEQQPTYYVTVELKNKKNKNKDKKTLSLNDLDTIIKKEIEDKLPKKFISKRTNEKKKIEPVIYIRKFNPRLTPYLESDEYFKKINNINKLDLNKDFPQL
jgi:hypothetical protein